MMRFVEFHSDAFRNDPRFAGFASRAGTQPSWVWKIALFAAAMVIVVPIVLLVGAAIVTFLLIFAVLAVVRKVADFFSSLFGGGVGDDGRRNVRVIRHEGS